MKLSYDTKRNPIMTSVLILVSITTLLYVLMNVDLKAAVFGKIGPREPSLETMSKEQYAEVLALAKQQNAQRQDTSPEPAIQIAAPKEQVTEQRAPSTKTKEPGSIYQYIDTSGMVVMVDDLEKVPVKYRAKMKTSSSMYGQQRTAVKMINNQIWVPVTLGHKGRMVTTWLLLDTGATNTSISPALAQRLGIQAADTNSGKATLADGRMVQTAHVVIDHVTTGPKVKRDLNVQILPRAGDEETGLLGMNFLSEFPHIVDTKAGIIRWQ